MLSGWGSSTCHASRKCCACAPVELLAGIIIWSVKRTQLAGAAAYPQTVWNNIDVVRLRSDCTGCHGRRRTLPLSLGLWIWYQSEIHFMSLQLTNQQLMKPNPHSPTTQPNSSVHCPFTSRYSLGWSRNFVFLRNTEVHYSVHMLLELGVSSSHLVVHWFRGLLNDDISTADKILGRIGWKDVLLMTCKSLIGCGCVSQK